MDVRTIVCFEQLEPGVSKDLVVDPDEALAKRARDASTICSLDAVSRALIDEIQANQIYGRNGRQPPSRTVSASSSSSNNSKLQNDASKSIPSHTHHPSSPTMRKKMVPKRTKSFECKKGIMATYHVTSSNGILVSSRAA